MWFRVEICGLAKILLVMQNKATYLFQDYCGWFCLSVCSMMHQCMPVWTRIAYLTVYSNLEPPNQKTSLTKCFPINKFTRTTRSVVAEIWNSNYALKFVHVAFCMLRCACCIVHVALCMLRCAYYVKRLCQLVKRWMCVLILVSIKRSCQLGKCSMLVPIGWDKMSNKLLHKSSVSCRPMRGQLCTASTNQKAGNLGRTDKQANKQTELTVYWVAPQLKKGMNTMIRICGSEEDGKTPIGIASSL